MKKLLKTAICTLLLTATIASNVFAADFDWNNVFHKITNYPEYSMKFTPFDDRQIALLDQYSVTSNAEATSDGVTIKVNRIIGDRYTAMVVLDVIQNNGKPLSGKEYSMILFDLKQDASIQRNSSPVEGQVGVTQLDTNFKMSPDYVRIYDKKEKTGTNDNPYGRHLVSGSFALFPQFFNNDPTDNKIQMVCLFGADKIMDHRLVLHLSDIAEVLPGTDESNFSDASRYKPISNGTWDLEIEFDYPDIYKEYTVNEYFKVFYEGRNRNIRVRKAIITPLAVYIDGDVERIEGERVKNPFVHVKMADGRILNQKQLYSAFQPSGFAASFDGVLDIPNEGENIQSLIIAGHEIKIKN